MNLARTGLLIMIEGSPIASLACGFLCVGIGWDDQPLHSDPALVFELPLADGILAVLVLENRLVVEIGRHEKGNEEIIDQWITPELLRPSGSAAVLTLQWVDGIINIFHLNSKEVPRHSEVEEFTIEQQGNKSEKQTELVVATAVNLDVLRIGSPLPFTIKQLIQTTLRLESSLKQMRSNTPESVLDISVYLRTLLCGTSKNGGQLLFRGAEEVGILPICYTVSGLDYYTDAPPFMDDKTTVLRCGAAGLPRERMLIETDLKKWLEQPAIIMFNNYSVPHWKLIYEVAGKFGAHADGNPNFLFSFMSHHDVGINLGVLVPQFRSYADVALEASKRVIAQRQS